MTDGESDPKSDLTFVTVDEMWDELVRRHDAVVLLMVSAVTDSTSAFSARSHGRSAWETLGLVTAAHAKMQRDALPRPDEERS